MNQRSFLSRLAMPQASAVVCLIVITLLESAADASKSYSWVQATAAGPWPAVFGVAGAAFGGKLWVIHESANNSDVLNEIWSSEDGMNWTKVSADAPWGMRYGQMVQEFDGKLWVLGGRTTSPWRPVNDEWASPNGTDWTLVVPSASWTAPGCQSAVLDGVFWVWYSDYEPPTGSLRRDVTLLWYSKDGLSWTQSTDRDQIPWTPRGGFGCVAFKHKLWMIGGMRGDLSGNCFPMNDVWCSPDGVIWTQVTTGAAWHGRDIPTVVVFDDKLWVLGGYYIEGSGRDSHAVALNDVWYSSDGQNWTELPGTPWSPRYGQQTAVVFDGKLWVFGRDGFNDVWYLTAPEPPSVSIETGHAPWYQVGEPLNLKVVGTDLSGEETYHWLKDGSDRPDQSTSVYHLDAVSLDDSGLYSCLVNDPANTGTLTAGPVSIMVLPPGYRLPLVSVIGVLLIVISVAIGVRAINFRRT